MKKVMLLFMKNIKLILAFIIGGLFFRSLSVIAVSSLTASSIAYNNTTLNVNTAQEAIDKLYENVRSDKFFLRQYLQESDKPVYYSYSYTEKPTTLSPTTPPTDKYIYFGLYADGQYGLCIKRNGKENCIRANNWIGEFQHFILDIFAGSACPRNIGDKGSGVSCRVYDYYCDLYENGSLYCWHYASNKKCSLNNDGTMGCR